VAQLITTIIPVFNRPLLLAEAVNSVLGQTHRPIEIIIVDDGSTDTTPEVAEELRTAHPESIRVLRQANGGPGRARQSGLDVARGEFIQFLDSDDLLLPKKFEKQVELLNIHPECHVCYGISHEQILSDGSQITTTPLKGTGTPRDRLFPQLLNERWWSTHTPLYKYSALANIGPWKPWINEEDWEYEARLAASEVRLVWLAESVSITRRNQNEPHLSSEGSSNPIKLSHRALAQQSIFRCARQVGVSLDSPEMKRFSRSAFLLSRQCAETGLEAEAADLQ